MAVSAGVRAIAATTAHRNTFVIMFAPPFPDRIRTIWLAIRLKEPPALPIRPVAYVYQSEALKASVCDECMTFFPGWVCGSGTRPRRRRRERGDAGVRRPAKAVRKPVTARP